jgi:hypothetical protein
MPAAQIDYLIYRYKKALAKLVRAFLYNGLLHLLGLLSGLLLVEVIE